MAETLVTLTGEDALQHPFTVDTPGEAWAALTLSAPGTSWSRGDPAVVTADLDHLHQQEIILAGGEEPAEYLRLLGHVGPGTHILRLRLQRILSAPTARTVTICALRVGVVGDRDPAAFIWRHAPVLHYRALDSQLDSLTTDTPLLLFYRASAGPGGDGVEYHAVFSHEDEGTDLTGLLARWGHTTDIEWIYRVRRAAGDEGSETTAAEFQGPHHQTVLYHGGHALGGHPVLQVATRNGLVTDRVVCPFRAALAPALAQPPGEPREGVLHQFPWIYRVSGLEVHRQVALDPQRSPASPAAADPRSYVFLQWKRAAGATLPLEAAVQAHGAWHTSAGGRRDLAFEGPDGESTAVMLPPGVTEVDVTGISLRAFEPPDGEAEIRLVRVFFLDEEYRPRPSLAAGGVCRLTSARPHAIVWQRGQRSPTSPDTPHSDEQCGE
ncbi:MAG TPA: hypothetical protein VFW01_05910 [bacterium]|nr:hypothetical protein [bacterium]